MLKSLEYSRESLTKQSFQPHVRKSTIDFANAVKEVHKYHSDKVQSLALHKLVLQKYTFFDIRSGMLSSHLRVVRPKTKYFIEHSDRLNLNGIFHVRSYILKMYGILEAEVNTWKGIPEVCDPPDVERDLRKAWERTRRGEAIDEVFCARLTAGR